MWECGKCGNVCVSVHTNLSCYTHVQCDYHNSHRLYHHHPASPLLVLGWGVSGSLGKFRGQFRSHLDPETDVENAESGVSDSLERFRGQFRCHLDSETILEKVEGVLGGFGVNTTCYGTHEILVLEGFGVF